MVLLRMGTSFRRLHVVFLLRAVFVTVKVFFFFTIIGFHRIKAAQKPIHSLSPLCARRLHRRSIHSSAMDCRKIRRRPSDGSSLPNSSSAVDSSVEKVLAAVLSSLLFTSSSGGYHKVICLNSECKPWIIHIVSLLVILSTYAMEDGQTATSVPHHHNGVIAFTSEQTLLSYPQFPSLPTSSQVELVPIHISFGCDTILLVIVWCLLCFSGVVRGPLSLDSS